MRKLGILAVLLVSLSVSPYGFSQCSNGSRSRLIAVLQDRSSYAAVVDVQSNGRWYPGKRVVRQNGRLVIKSKIGLGIFPILK